ncbi:DUF3551 domain-containing protein [Nitrobacteraceae bacterium UC4446_H13]
MKATRNVVLVSAVLVFAAVFAVIPAANSQDKQSISAGQYCLMYSEGGTDCSFSSYAQCRETAAGIAAECYRTSVFDRDFRRSSRKSGARRLYAD